MNTPTIPNMKERFAEIRKKYEDDPKSTTFNALICGEVGTGKTHLLKTARKPVLLHCFDPGGEKTLADEIKKGEVLVENFAPDDPYKPWAFEAWIRCMNDHFREDDFKHFGTYALDSSTHWANSILNFYLKRRGSAGKAPDGKLDYMPQKVEIQNWLTRLLALPCDIIVTGHLEAIKDEVNGRITYRYATTGKGTTFVPTLFDEVYVALAEDTSKGVNYKLQTAGAGRYMARSRLAQGGKIPQFIAPDLKDILKKAGLSTEDKPLFL